MWLVCKPSVQFFSTSLLMSHALFTAGSSSDWEGFQLDWGQASCQPTSGTYCCHYLSGKWKRQTWFFHDFQKATFLHFLAPFLNKLTENSEIELDLKKIRCRLRISPRNGQNSFSKSTYLSLKLLQYLWPR